MYISREDVNRWAAKAPEPEVCHVSCIICAIYSLLRGQVPDELDGDCRERWKNMKTENTARAWGVFDETGIFAAFCRHGFTLSLADMVRSGEQ